MECSQAQRICCKHSNSGLRAPHKKLVAIVIIVILILTIVKIVIVIVLVIIVMMIRSA